MAKNIDHNKEIDLQTDDEIIKRTSQLLQRFGDELDAGYRQQFDDRLPIMPWLIAPFNRRRPQGANTTSTQVVNDTVFFLHFTILLYAGVQILQDFKT